MQQNTTLQNVRYNFAVNVADGTFFGLGFGFSSFTAVIPLFFATLTENTALIGFVSALHTIGWALPQMFTAQRVARMRRYKPFVLLMTLNERLPFFLLALVALFSPQMDKGLALAFALFLVTWHSLGGGMAGTAWQSLIGKIMPPNRRGTFWGVQAAAANLTLSAGAIVAGLILEKIDGPVDFALCFLITGIFMMVSFGFLAATREPDSDPAQLPQQTRASWRDFGRIIKKDLNFRWFLLARCLSQVATMAISFYAIYAIRHLGMDEQTAGMMVGVMALAQTAGNLVLGWIGDHWGHRKVMVFGALLLTASAFVAMLAPSQGWFYLVFTLAGISNATMWATAMALTIEFGSPAEKPLYIGVTNTAQALPAIAAPILGGWLADIASFQATFLVSVIGGLLMAVILFLVVRDPNPRPAQVMEPAVEGADVPA
ncbi:MAG: MFS transporter [Anaerolineae bacterium]